MGVTCECSVIIPSCGEWKTSEACLQSVRAANDERVFSNLHILPISGDNPASARNAGIDAAVERQAEWIFFLEPDELMHANAMANLAPAMQNHEAVWGALGLGGGRIPKQTMFCCSSNPAFYHMALNWHVGRSHLVKTQQADQNRFNNRAGEAWYGDYLLRMWKSASCLKTAQPFTRCEELQPVNEADKELLVRDLAENPQYISFDYGSEKIKLPYTGRNPVLERVQLRGLFYEQEELEAIAQKIGTGAVIVDVGANTGNHAIFFASVMKAKKVIPIEPNPDAIAILKAAVRANGLENADFSRLGVAAGAERGKAGLNTGRRGHLGTAVIETAEQGEFEILPLDEMIDERVDFIKIDVESMELGVLSGARDLIAASRPVIFIEVRDENIMPFLDITSGLGYTVEKVFADHGYANYLLVPGADSQG